MKTQLKVNIRNYKKSRVSAGEFHLHYEAESQESSELPPSLSLRIKTLWKDQNEMVFHYIITSQGMIEVFDMSRTKETIYYGRGLETSNLIILIFSNQKERLILLEVENALLGEYIPRSIHSFAPNINVFYNYNNRPNGKCFPRYTYTLTSYSVRFLYCKDQPEIEFNYDIIIGKDANGNISAFRIDRGNKHVK